MGKDDVYTSQAVQPKLVDALHGAGVLPVVLYDVDVVGGGEEAGKGAGFGVPEGGGDDAWRDCMEVISPLNHNGDGEWVMGLCGRVVVGVAEEEESRAFPTHHSVSRRSGSS